MMYPANDNPANCEIHAVTLFLHNKNMSVAEIHRELCAADYTQNIMSEGTIRQWCKFSKMGKHVHDEE
jgi:hypothetical protein